MKQQNEDISIGLIKIISKESCNGIIQHYNLGEHVFFKRGINKGEILNLNDIVAFISRPSLNNKKKEAINIKHIKHLLDETEYLSLFNHFLSMQIEKSEYANKNEFVKTISSQISSLLRKEELVDAKQKLFDIYSDFLNINLHNYSKNEMFLKRILDICRSFFNDKYKDVSESIEQVVNTEIVHNLWLEDYVASCQIGHIKSVLLSANKKTKVKIFKRCSEIDKQNVFAAILDDLININSENKLKEIKGFLKLCKDYYPEFYRQSEKLLNKKIDEATLHCLWLEDYMNACQVNYIAKIILDVDRHVQQRIFERCQEEEMENIFLKVIKTFKKIDSEQIQEKVKTLLKLSKEFSGGQYVKILSAIMNICPEHFKLSLWLDDLNPNLDFDAYKIFIVLLSPSDQKRFVKKVLKEIHEKKINLAIEDFTSLNIIDYESSKAVNKIDNSNLDYSTSIILNTIQQLHNQTTIESKQGANEAKKKIFDLILNQIKEPDDILQITGFFDECGGRCFISVDEEKNEKGDVVKKHINYHRNEQNKPKLHPICDGRKAVNQITNNFALEENQIEFWWCANQKCYKPSRQLHNQENWESYTLLDFLSILKVKFIEKDLEIYLNLINKVNIFLKHLKCRKCNHILRPIKQSNYAFYGVNDFHCTNETCEEKGKSIYLTHCLNGKCEQTIDSRDSVKCQPTGFDSDKCGWYVCNYCHSCCSDEGISKRQYILERTGQEYKCHKKGHRNQGIICCNKCGNYMESSEFNEEEYNKILNQFISIRNTSSRISRSGKNKFGKWWFLIKRENEEYEVFRQKLNKYYQLGFQIPDLHQDKELQLISEPLDYQQHRSEILNCKFCNNTLDLSNDLEKAWTIKHFHNVRFVRQTNET
jgi:hypothetical protein